VISRAGFATVLLYLLQPAEREICAPPRLLWA